MPEKTLNISLTSNLSLDMVFVEGGNFLMGDDSSKNDWEKPAHKIEINSFYIGRYQLTQEVWQSVMGNNPSSFKGKNQPVEQVSWPQVQGFLEKLNKQSKKDFRLPTEAEWEYAARGGKYSEDYLYAGSDKLKQVGWYTENSNGQTHEIGQLLANELGLYDMSGNVWEWCEDDYHYDYRGAPNDGSAWVDMPAKDASRVLRGGDFLYDAVNCRSTYRNRSAPGNRLSRIGFRLVLPLKSGS